MAVPARRRPVDSSGVYSTDESSPHLSTVCYVENQDTYPGALGTINEFGGMDGRISSLPSSYRRLRKAKSMFSTRQRGSQMSYGISSDSYGSPRANQDTSTESRPYGTLRRSMSFLRGQPSRSVRHAKSQDAAIQLARTQFLENHKPSMATLKPKREHKPFRKTFRAPSDPLTDDTGTPFSDGSKANGGIHGKARSFSSTIKKGLKRVLGLSKPPEEPSTVEHQWDDQRSSIDSSASQDYTPGSAYSDYDSPGQQYASSPTRPPTIQTARSSESLATSRSRVTSWADSTAANTVTTRKPGDRNPLSIIDENGTPTPGGRSSRSSPRPLPSVDGQRLYSALMKHIGQTKAENPDEHVVLGHVKEHHPIPERTSSLHTCRSRQTIRQIPSNDSMASPVSYSTANGGMMTPQRQRPHQAKRQLNHGQRYTQANEDDRFDNTSGLRRPLDSLFEIGEHSDDEAGSIIVDPSKHLDEMDSPSVYSRTTSGDSPGRNDHTGLASHEGKDEPGMAMIYESQRSVYRSPKQKSGSASAVTPTQPSADWQKWMNSQMARIELPPKREHQREEAQIHEDDNDTDIDTRAPSMFNGRDTVRRAYAPLGLGEASSTNTKVPVQSNFSRPFSRSSSVRSRAASQRTLTADGTDLNRGLSLSVRPSNRLQLPESPTPKRDSTGSLQGMTTGQYRRYPTARMPISRDAKAVPFRSVRSQRENRRPADENVKPDHGRAGTGRYKYQNEHSPISSKQMVDDFLDSRRRQMETADDGSRSAFI